MPEQVNDIQALAIVLVVLVATVGAARVAAFAIEVGRPILLLGCWLAAMAGSVVVLVAMPALIGGWRPLLSLTLAMAFVREHDLPLAALLVLGAIAAAAMAMLSAARRSAVADARAGAVGAAGESLVALELRQAGFPAVHGIMLGGRGWSTEIDHVVRTAGSIVAIETKTLAGRVEGRPNDRQWVQRTDGHARWFLNPLRQNATHLEAMRQAIGPIEVPLRGLVVVAGTATIGEELCGYVVPVSELVQLLRQDPSSDTRGLDRAWSILRLLAERGGDRRVHAAYVWRRRRRA